MYQRARRRSCRRPPVQKRFGRRDSRRLVMTATRDGNARMTVREGGGDARRRLAIEIGHAGLPRRPGAGLRGERAVLSRRRSGADPGAASSGAGGCGLKRRRQGRSTQRPDGRAPGDQTSAVLFEEGDVRRASTTLNASLAGGRGSGTLPRGASVSAQACGRAPLASWRRGPARPVDAPRLAGAALMAASTQSARRPAARARYMVTGAADVPRSRSRAREEIRRRRRWRTNARRRRRGRGRWRCVERPRVVAGRWRSHRTVPMTSRARCGFTIST